MVTLRVVGLEAGDPGGLGGALCGGADAVEGAGQVARDAFEVVDAVLPPSFDAHASERDGGGGQDGQRSARTLEFHSCPFRGSLQDGGSVLTRQRRYSRCLTSVPRSGKRKVNERCVLGSCRRDPPAAVPLRRAGSRSRSRRCPSWGWSTRGARRRTRRSRGRRRCSGRSRGTVPVASAISRRISGSTGPWLQSTALLRDRTRLPTTSRTSAVAVLVGILADARSRAWARCRWMRPAAPPSPRTAPRGWSRSCAGRQAAMVGAIARRLVRPRAAVSGRVLSGPSQVCGGAALPWRSAMRAKVVLTPSREQLRERVEDLDVALVAEVAARLLDGHPFQRGDLAVGHERRPLRSPRRVDFGGPVVHDLVAAARSAYSRPRAARRERRRGRSLRRSRARPSAAASRRVDLALGDGDIAVCCVRWTSRIMRLAVDDAPADGPRSVDRRCSVIALDPARAPVRRSAA